MLIKDNKVKIAAVEGKASESAYYARTAKVIAERLGCPHYVISGNHIPFVVDPATCAAELRPILKAFEIQQV
jgi:hypothetical protein